jgi:hypothetical protein
VCSVRVEKASEIPERPDAEVPLTTRGAIKDPLTR